MRHQPTQKIVQLTIRGMSCVHCVRAVFTALSGVEGIVHADVSIGGARVEHDGRATPAMLAEAIAVAGYEVTGSAEEKRRLPIAGSGQWGVGSGEL